MPVGEVDPWRLQYFTGIPCADDILVPTEDADAYRLYPAHRWVYNKLLIADSQGIENGPHGLDPAAFPVFSKPIYNMRGMGIGSRILHSRAEYLAALAPGHMWMRLLDGEHVSSDVAVLAGRAQWWRHATGLARGGGTFDYWTVHAAPRLALEAHCGRWIAEHLSGYTGMVNLETIAGHIIEVHLRFADQWPDLYGGAPWVRAVIALYAEGHWRFDDAERRTGYSVVLFGEHGTAYRGPRPAMLAGVLGQPHISSVQITFHEDRAGAHHAMPPGGFRLAIVNGWDLAAGRAARETLALLFQGDLRARRRRWGAPSG